MPQPAHPLRGKGLAVANQRPASGRKDHVMFQELPFEAVIGVGAFIFSLVLLALIHGVASAVESAKASRREAARLVGELNALVAAVDRNGRGGPQGGAGGGSPKPVRRRRVVGGQRAAPGQGRRQPYGPRSMAGR